mgnify:FL=1
MYLALGSNQGDRLEYLNQALKSFPPAVEVIEPSPVYETEPWGYEDQPDFLNQVVKAKTSLSPRELLDYLQGIEQHLGRKRTFRNAPRGIDLDILYYGDQVIDLEYLQIPHPGIPERDFVLVPLADIAPDLRSPRSGRMVREMLADIDADDIQRYQP